MNVMPGRTAGWRRGSFGANDAAASRGPGSLLPLCVAVAVVAVTVLAGGGGKRFPLAEIAVELVALGGLGAAILFAVQRGLPRGWMLPTAIIVLLALLVIVQIVPLPASLWETLPGRALAAEIVAANGGVGVARPLSLDPEATLRSGLAMLPAFALFFLTLQLDRRGRALVVRAVLLLAIVSLLLSALQVSTRSQSLYPFSLGHYGYAVGLFSNRNHQASFLLIAIVMSGLFVARDGFGLSPRIRHAMGLGLLVAFTIGVVATISRMGTLLLPLAWLGYAVLTVSIDARRLRWTLAPLGLLALAGVLLVSQSSVIRATLARFDDLNDSRFIIWRDTQWSIDQYLPVGSGLGTFERIFAADQPLATVGQLYVNHAHNEYLEVLLETGFAAPLLLVLFLAYLARSAFALRMPARIHDRPAAIAGFTVIAIAMAHSLVDYPLRTLAIMGLFGMAAALLLPPRQAPRD